MLNLTGKREGSKTDPFASRMTTTFDHFYNCSGMDDLPPQVAMYAQNKKSDCAPALTTSQLIRMAKILRMIAQEEGMTEDVKVYDEDIALRSQTLQTYAWDEESGYFGYVVHDEKKQPIGIFGNESGENYPKGMDSSISLADYLRRLIHVCLYDFRVFISCLKSNIVLENFDGKAASLEYDDVKRN